MEEHLHPLHTKHTSRPPAGIVLSLLVVLTMFGSGIYILAFYLK